MFCFPTTLSKSKVIREHDAVPDVWSRRLQRKQESLLSHRAIGSKDVWYIYQSMNCLILFGFCKFVGVYHLYRCFRRENVYGDFLSEWISYSARFIKWWNQQKSQDLHDLVVALVENIFTLMHVVNDWELRCFQVFPRWAMRSIVSTSWAFSMCFMLQRKKDQKSMGRFPYCRWYVRGNSLWPFSDV